jgi:hypothetical protein
MKIIRERITLKKRTIGRKEQDNEENTRKEEGTYIKERVIMDERRDWD